MPDQSLTLDEIKRLENHDLGVSEWVTIDQAKLDTHAETTGDTHRLHDDPERAARESPYDGKTIAQGFLMLAHVTRWAVEMLPRMSDLDHGLNYGLNRARFIDPVVVGSRIQGHLAVKSVVEKDPTRYLMTVKCSIEVEGRERPAVVAEWLLMLFSG
jgi:acyl dehydratase